MLQALTEMYGNSAFSCEDIFVRLHKQSFPLLGEPVVIRSGKNFERRVERPVDPRLDGSPIANMLTLEQLILLYSTVTKEGRVVIISSNLG